MATITQNLQIIKDSTADIKQAIIDKGGEIQGDLTTYADAIAKIPSGDAASKNDVTFYDYDGTILYSYTAEEFLALTEMPPLPSRKGLICQGWNYEIEDAMSYVAEYGILDIGANYITDDGKTRLYIRITAEGRMTVPFCFIQSVDNGVVIDWGDGSATQTFSGTGEKNTSHTYASVGDYCITLEVTSGTLSLGNETSSFCVLGNIGNAGKVYCNMLQKVEIGAGITSLNYAFQNCYSLSSISIPASVTKIGYNAFSRNVSLSFVVIPSGTITISTNLFYNGYALNSVAIPSSVTSLGYTFINCWSLSSVVIPSNVTSIGTSVFYGCYSLPLIIIPPSVTSIGNEAFYNCYSVAFYDFSHHTSVPTLSNINAFTGILSNCKIIVPDSLYDTWIAATNWSIYADYIVKSSEYKSQK